MLILRREPSGIGKTCHACRRPIQGAVLVLEDAGGNRCYSHPGCSQVDHDGRRAQIAESAEVRDA
jgi:hypothetical protein